MVKFLHTFFAQRTLTTEYESKCMYCAIWKGIQGFVLASSVRSPNDRIQLECWNELSGYVGAKRTAASLIVFRKLISMGSRLVIVNYTILNETCDVPVLCFAIKTTVSFGKGKKKRSGWVRFQRSHFRWWGSTLMVGYIAPTMWCTIFILNQHFQSWKLSTTSSFKIGNRFSTLMIKSSSCYDLKISKRVFFS